jgi:serpin B
MRMKRVSRLLLALGCALPGFAASADAAPPSPTGAPTMNALSRFAGDSNAFGFDLYRQLRSQPGNLVLSPASISMALAMAWSGARGQTAQQMQQALHFEGTPEAVTRAAGELSRQLQDPARPIKFRIANRLFGEKTYAFEQPWLDATRAAFGAPLEALDFRHAADAARQRINAWVEQQTEQRIQNLIPPGGLNAETRLALVNAIYFLGDWEQPFKKETTSPQPFHTSAAAQKDVPTMFQQGSFRYAQHDGCKALELSYKGHNMSMLLVLPDAVDGIAGLEQSLDAAKLDALVAALQPQTVRVWLPKFEINPAGAMALSGPLQQLGIALAFDQHQADFSGMANPPDPQDRLYLSQVYHKAYVKVDEKGTEAAAATAAIMAAARAMMRPPQVMEFKADHPFLFFIHDDASGIVLFSGRVMEP